MYSLIYTNQCNTEHIILKEFTVETDLYAQTLIVKFTKGG